MQVSVEAGEGLQRKLSVQVPSETLEVEIENRLQSMQGRVKVDGFRPGKVPLSVVRQRYGAQVFQEVVGEMVQTTFRDAVTQENLRLAGDPSIDAAGFEPGKPLEYTATFEIYPEVVLNPVSGLSFEAKTAEVADSDVDTMLDTLRKQKADWAEVERKSKEGDRVTVNFVGTVDGVAFEGGTAEDVPVTLGSGAMIPGFEENLSGLSTKEESRFEVTFPDDYQATELAGKVAEFQITVNRIEESVLPEIDDEFASGFGVTEGGIERLKQDVKGNMQRELVNRIKADTKNTVMEKLLEANPVDVPQAIIMEEAETLKQQTSAQQPGADLPLESFMADAKRRVQLGMILAEVAKTSAIQITADSVKERIELMAKDYEDPAEFVSYYSNNPQLMRGVETLVMEDMVVDWVVDQATVTQVDSTFEAIMNPELVK